MMVGAATVFVVTDIAKSTEHYRDVLGFILPGWQWSVCTLDLIPSSLRLRAGISFCLRPTACRIF